MNTTPITTVEALRNLKKLYKKVVPLYDKQCYMVTGRDGEQTLVDENDHELSAARQRELQGSWMHHNGGVIVSNALVLHLCTETGYTALFTGKKSKWE